MTTMEPAENEQLKVTSDKQEHDKDLEVIERSDSIKSVAVAGKRLHLTLAALVPALMCLTKTSLASATYS
jgi:hypothetical protein